MEAIKDRLINITTDLKELHDEYGVLSADAGIHVRHNNWSDFAKGETVKVHSRGPEDPFPLETSFVKNGVRFFAVWTIEEYLEEADHA